MCVVRKSLQQFVRVNKEEHVCLWTFDLCIIQSLEHKFEDYKQVVFWGSVMWCQVTVSQANLSLEACSGSWEFMCPCFCSTYFILFSQIKVRDGKRNVCTSASAQSILYSSHNKGYGWVRNVSTFLINALIYRVTELVEPVTFIFLPWLTVALFRVAGLLT